jgi:hypothetical protein
VVLINLSSVIGAHLCVAIFGSDDALVVAELIDEFCLRTNDPSGLAVV